MPRFTIDYKNLFELTTLLCDGLGTGVIARMFFYSFSALTASAGCQRTSRADAHPRGARMTGSATFPFNNSLGQKHINKN
jgi:hypothetical protein